MNLMINHPLLSFYGLLLAHFSNGSRLEAICSILEETSRYATNLSKEEVGAVLDFYVLTESHAIEALKISICKWMFRDFALVIDEIDVRGIFEKWLKLAGISHHVFIYVLNDRPGYFISNRPERLLELMTELRFCKPYQTHIFVQGSKTYL